MKISEILNFLKDEIIDTRMDIDENTEINNFKDNSENVEKNDVFIAIKGLKFDGHDFIYSALSRGAAFVILDDPEKIPEDTSLNYVQIKNTKKVIAELTYKNKHITPNDFKFFAVTGTNGKSTVATLVHHILQETGKKSTLFSTVDIRIKDKVIEEPYNTTPSVIKISEILEKSKLENVEFINMEVSSHALHQKRVEKLEFDLISYTNITRDHLDYHHTFKEYYDTKLSLTKYMKKDGKAIVNIDDIDINKFKLPKKKIITYGFSDDADYKIKSINQSIYQMNFKIDTPEGEEISIYSSIIGKFNAYNITNALIICKEYGLSYDQIKHGIITFKGVKGRFELIPSSKALGFSVVIDFAHTPDALDKVLSNAKDIVKGRIILVFGAGGNADIGKREIMGEVASKYSDIIVLTTDDPKDEDPEKIIEQVKLGIKKERNFIVIPERKTAINAAVNFANRDDLVIIAGRGHEKFQLFANGKQIKFNDFEIASDCIDSLRRSMKK
ncbi:MAG: UDP-N-acetylmuramoyl-L-alanyl-D-glutamate--2,6-diaminopimelate ligase [Thermotogota bacterium]